MKRFWNRVQKALDIHNIAPNLSSEAKDGKRLKSLFITYFDRAYGIYPEPNTFNTFAMGVCKLEYKNKTLIVHLRKPGLLIGKNGRIIDDLTKELNCKIDIVEVNLLNEV